MKAVQKIRLVMIAAILVATYTGCKKDSVDETAVSKDTFTGKPYRTFVTFQRYNLEQTGEGQEVISNVRLEVTLPDGRKMGLPENGQYWPIGHAQSQEINRTLEIPWSSIRNDGFKMTIQMVRRGTEYLPCVFDVVQISQFNRAYVCHTDVSAQINQEKATELTVDKEGVQIRVFTDLNSPSRQIPADLARSR